MAGMSAQHLVSEILIRKQWKQVQIMESEGFSEPNISRIMSRVQDPRIDTFDKLLASFTIAPDTIHIPRLLDVDLDMLTRFAALEQLTERLRFDPAARETASAYIDEMTATGLFDEGYNRHMLLGCQLQLEAVSNTPKETLQAKALEGLHITYPEFNPETYKGEILILGEPRLLHVYACAVAEQNRLSAIQLLQYAVTGIDKTPQDEKYKEQFLAPILYDLARLLDEGNQPEAALAVCEKGAEMSLHRNKGRHLPDFALHKAQLLKRVGRLAEVKPLLQQAFFGYIMLGRRPCAMEVKAYAQSLGMDFNTYQAEEISFPRPVHTPQRRTPISGKTPGAILAQLRHDANIKQSELCAGICTAATLNKIENGSLRGTVYQLEALMQRLGRDIDLYFNTVVSSVVFEEKQLRDKVWTLLAHNKYSEADILLQELKKRKDYKAGLGLQFVLICEANIYREKNNSDETYMALIKKGWYLTRKETSFDEAVNSRLSFYEIILLYLAAIYYYANGELTRGISLYEKLINNIKFLYKDETEIMRTYPALLCNLAIVKNKAGLYHESFIHVTEGRHLSLLYNDLRSAYGFTVCGVGILLASENMEACKTYSAIGYHVAGLLGGGKNQADAKEYIINNGIDITFD
jgi:transcriptional regulator with XRE-family HTH domain